MRLLPRPANRPPSRGGRSRWSLAMTTLIFLSASLMCLAQQEPEEETPVAPIQIRVEAQSGKFVNTGTCQVFIETNPLWPVPVESKGEIELFLRLPQGIALKSSGWTDVELPPEDQKGENGTWKLHQKTTPVMPPETPVSPVGIPVLLAQIPVELTVEEGHNWVITVRARLIQEGKAWATFSALFATRQGEEAWFHVTPQIPTGPTLSQKSHNAQTN